MCPSPVLGIEETEIIKTMAKNKVPGKTGTEIGKPIWKVQR